MLLALVLVVGEESHGAVRWLRFGVFQLQPSEIEKVILVISVAAWGSLASVKTYPSFSQIAIFFCFSIPPCVLVFVEPDLGTSLLLFITSVVMLFVLGIRKTVIVAALILGMIVVYPLWNYGLKDYQKDRIRTLLDPDRDPKKRGYHIRQSRIAIGSGMIWGKGYLQGTQSKLKFLPERHTDFAFAVWAEEWGFAGSAVLLGLFGLFAYFASQIALLARDKFGSLLVIGLTSNIMLEIVVNIGMVIGLFPVVGVPLPFISYGGSALLRVWISVGLIENVSMRRYSMRH